MSQKDEFAESDWFPETIVTESAEAILRKNLCNFFQNSAGELKGNTRSPIVYWHRGSFSDFVQSMGTLACRVEIEATLTISGYEYPIYRGNAAVCWTLVGVDLPIAGTRFKVYDLEQLRWIGAGSVVLCDEEYWALVDEGVWHDFYNVDASPGKLVILFYEGGGVES